MYRWTEYSVSNKAKKKEIEIYYTTQNKPVVHTGLFYVYIYIYIYIIYIDSEDIKYILIKRFELKIKRNMRNKY